MKKMRKLVPAFAMLMVAAIMMSTASFAWFTMSNTAAATGMQVQATASSSMLIVKTNDLPTWLAASGNIDYPAATNKLAPATHDTAFSSGLKTLTESAAGDVVSATGAYSGSGYTNATTNNYVDYIAYIGTTGVAMEDVTLKASVSIASDLVYPIHNAVSIDFYVQDTYGATINLKTADAGTNNATDYVAITGTVIDIPTVIKVDNGTQKLTGEFVKVTMRVYFDGALTDADSNCYVRNAMATTENIGFSVDFKAE